MRSARATIGRSFEPWAAARSKRGRLRAQRQSAVERPARLRSLPPAERPPCAPTAQRVDARELRELECLREVARRDLDFVAGRSQPLHERPEDDRVGGCREVDPDPHRRPPTRGVS